MADYETFAGLVASGLQNRCARWALFFRIVSLAGVFHPLSIMRFLSWLAAFLGVLMGGCLAKADTNSFFGVGLTANPPTSVFVGQQLVYTIDVTNIAPGALTQVVISNALPLNSSLVGVGATFGTVQTSASAAVITVLAFGAGQVVEVVITNTPTATGLLTNLVSVSASGIANLVTTNIVSAVTGQADLGVIWSDAPNAALAYDLISFTLSVTNAGPSTIPNPIVNVSFPAGLSLLGVNSGTATVSTTNAANSLTLTLSSLAATNSQQFQFNFQPTNEFTNSLTAAVNSSGYQDSNLTNNVANIQLVIAPPPAGNPVLTVLSTNAVLNLQTGLLEESVRVTNKGTNTIAATRITILDETNVVANASGTNGLDPFVTIISPLAPQQSLDFVLEFNVPKRHLDLLPSLLATPVLTPNINTPTGASLPILRWAILTTNRFLLEFAATAGARYTVEYSDQPTFDVVHAAVPSVISPADKVQWIDHGPPNTAALGTGYLLQLTNIVALNTTTNTSGTNVTITTTYTNIVFTVATNSTVTPTKGLVLSTNAAPRFYRIIANP